MRFLKDLRIILAVVMILSWVAGGFLFWNFKTTNEQIIMGKDEEIASLQFEIEQIGELLPAYTVAADVPSGKKIEETDLQYIEVPTSMATNLVHDIEELIGKHYKVGLTAGTVITKDSIYEEVITADMRYYDVLVDVVPIGLKPGSFVDVRIKFGTGADFLGLSHRQVAAVNGKALKLILTEKDIHMFSSMLVDNIVFNQDFKATKDVNGDGSVNEQDRLKAIGAYLYAVEYVDGGIQDEAGDYFAPSEMVQAIMQGNPNILKKDNKYSPNDLILRRRLIEAGLEDTNDTASKIRDEVQQKIEEGRLIYEKELLKALESEQNQ